VANTAGTRLLVFSGLRLQELQEISRRDREGLVGPAVALTHGAATQRQPRMHECC